MPVGVGVALGTIRPYETLSRERRGSPRIRLAALRIVNGPSVQPVVEHLKMDRALRRPLENRRILVVEDDPMIALDLQCILEAAAATVLVRRAKLPRPSVSSRDLK
jgi:hypothetical protein